MLEKKALSVGRLCGDNKKMNEDYIYKYMLMLHSIEFEIFIKLMDIISQLKCLHVCIYSSTTFLPKD